MLVDSHCHLNFLDEPDLCLARAREQGVSGFLCIGVDQAGIGQVLALAEHHDDVWASVGQHPESAAAAPDWIEPHLSGAEVVAVGETGLDYHHVDDAAARGRQRDGFAYQLDLARRHNLPTVVHTRAAQEDTLALIRSCPGVTGVLHCFTESWDMARQALDLGWYVSISGIVTFASGANVREVARRVPLDRLLVETDAPWLAPVPFRGKPNEPAYVVSTARVVAELRGLAPAELALATTENFFRLFSRAQNSSSNS